LETGNGLIDAQHREMFDLIASLEALGPARQAGAFAIAASLMEHVDVHFAMEEDLMRASAYEDSKLEDHVLEHEALRQRARDAILAFRTGADPSSAGMVEFLRSWLWEHIEGQDRDLVAHLRDAWDPGLESE
jgi:hemerythrin-like metal-binding protein